MTTPESKFWLAVIEQSLMDVLHPEESGATFNEQVNALDWLRSDNCAPASFLWACMAAGIRASVVRDRLAERGL